MSFSKLDPNTADLQYQGILADVYHKQAGAKTFEYVVMPDSAKVLAITTDHKVVLLREIAYATKQQYYSLPGGRIEKGEDPMQAARRELLEETGLHATNISVWFTRNYSQTIMSTKYFFIATGCTLVAKQQLEDTEDVAVMQLSFDEFLEYASRDDFRQSEVQNEALKMRLDNNRKQDFIRQFGPQ